MRKDETIVVTGAAGFIGFHVSKALLSEGFFVIGIDNMNHYYDVDLKKDRLKELTKFPDFFFSNVDISDRQALDRVFAERTVTAVINLAAQAGVRYSLTNPYAYLDSNISGFLNILEQCRNRKIGHLIFASSSSVYGANRSMPFSVHHNVDHPISLYAATKKSNELMAHAYASLYKIPVTGLRFFTVYGPYGRPDMAACLFTKAILEGKPIEVFNRGEMKRDFTFIDDVVESIVRLVPKPPRPNPSWTGFDPDPATSFAPYKIYNVGNSNPITLLRFIEVLENKLNIKAIRKFLDMQMGDVPETFADVSDLANEVGFLPSTTIEEGLSRFVDWYLDYYKVKI
jgi:UDP-glucuronate 4-epimerase